MWWSHGRRAPLRPVATMVPVPSRRNPRRGHGLHKKRVPRPRVHGDDRRRRGLHADAAGPRDADGRRRARARGGRLRVRGPRARHVRMALRQREQRLLPARPHLLPESCDRDLRVARHLRPRRLLQRREERRHLHLHRQREGRRRQLHAGDRPDSHARELRDPRRPGEPPPPTGTRASPPIWARAASTSMPGSAAVPPPSTPRPDRASSSPAGPPGRPWTSRRRSATCATTRRACPATRVAPSSLGSARAEASPRSSAPRATRPSSSRTLPRSVPSPMTPRGAAVSDAIAGSASWCPVTSYDMADAAYEWCQGQYGADPLARRRHLDAAALARPGGCIRRLDQRDGPA